MILVLLDTATREFTGYTHKVIVNYTDLTAAGVTQTLQVFPLVTGSFGDTIGNSAEIHKTKIRMITPFVGNSLATLKVSLGDPGSVGRYIADTTTNLFTPSASNTKNNALGTATYAYTWADSTTNTKLQCLFTGTVGNFGDATTTLLTAGQCEIFFGLFDGRDLQRPVK